MQNIILADRWTKGMERQRFGDPAKVKMKISGYLMLLFFQKNGLLHPFPSQRIVSLNYTRTSALFFTENRNYWGFPQHS
jgi:hypothetical protein